MATKFLKSCTTVVCTRNLTDISSLKAHFHFGVVLNAGSKLRLARGQQRCGNEEGPLHDLPDWTTVGMCS